MTEIPPECLQTQVRPQVCTRSAPCRYRRSSGACTQYPEPQQKNTEKKS